MYVRVFIRGFALGVFDRLTGDVYVVVGDLGGIDRVWFCVGMLGSV